MEDLETEPIPFHANCVESEMDELDIKLLMQWTLSSLPPVLSPLPLL